MAKNKQYIALVALGRDVYDVVFPDFDGLVTQGDTYEDAVRNAHEALAMHIAGMREDGDKIPAPRDLADIKKDWWGWDDWRGTDYAVAMVSVIPAAVPRKYTLSMDARLMARIDAVTHNRSAFILRAVTEYLNSGQSEFSDNIPPVYLNGRGGSPAADLGHGGQVRQKIVS